MPSKKEIYSKRNDKLKYLKTKYSFLNKCPVCFKEYDCHWKVVSHIKKNKDLEHISLLNFHKIQASEIYINNDGDVFDFLEKLYIERNIFSAISNGHIISMIKDHLGLNNDEFEKIRKQKISQTMLKTEHSKEHNENVSKGVKRAWVDGKYSTEEYREAYLKGLIIRKDFSGKNNPMYGKPSPKGSGKGKGGIRKDLNMYFRSSWEANFCRILNYENTKFEYEKKRFKLNINGKDLTYCPDFYIIEKDLYYEIKGHAKSSSEWLCNCKNCSKGKEFIKHLNMNSVNIEIIGKKEYKELERKYSKLIKEWEFL